MQYFVYGRDRPGAGELKVELAEEHWAFMDRYGESLIARGPTLTSQDDEADSTGSMHVVDLPDEQAARRFAFEEPYYLAGAFKSVLLYRFRNLLGRTMWDFTEAVDGYGRFLVITLEEAESEPAASKHLIVYGDLLALDGETRIGRAAMVEAADLAAAAALLPASGDGRTEVHHWRFGGRSDQR